MERKFKIDFFEFSFLVEACIPPRPIARSMFWDDVIDIYFFEMTPDERERLFEWIQKNDNFNLKEERCAMFYARFNPDNQYDVIVGENGVSTKYYDCFMYKDCYYTSKNTFLIKEAIIEVLKK